MPEFNQENENDVASSSGVQNKDLEPNKSTLLEKDLEPRRGKRIKIAKDYRPDFLTFLTEADLKHIKRP